MSDNMWLYKLTMNDILDNNFHSCQAGGRGFESRRDRSGLPYGSLAAYVVRNSLHIALGRVAQLAERPPEKRKVTGSTPVSTTTGACRRLLTFSTSHLLIK